MAGKGFFGRLFEGLDRKLEEKAKQKTCCCKGCGGKAPKK